MPAVDRLHLVGTLGNGICRPREALQAENPSVFAELFAARWRPVEVATQPEGDWRKGQEAKPAVAQARLPAAESEPALTAVADGAWAGILLDATILSLSD